MAAAALSVSCAVGVLLVVVVVAVVGGGDLARDQTPNLDLEFADVAPMGGGGPLEGPRKNGH